MRQNLYHYLPATIRGISRFNHLLAGTIEDSNANSLEQQKLNSIPYIFRVHIAELGKAHSISDWVKNHTIDRKASTTGIVKRFFEKYSTYFSPENDDQTYLERIFVEAFLFPTFKDKLIDLVIPQYAVGRYRIDFVVIGDTKWAIETDGLGKFTKNSNAQNKYLVRQQELEVLGWRFLRYSYSQVKDNSERKHALWRFITTLRSDSKLRPHLNLKGFANIDNHTTPLNNKPFISDVIDWFYAVQGIVVTEIEASVIDTKYITFVDKTNLSIPLCAFAISSLLDHLSMIEQVLGISFALPFIRLALSDDALKYLTDNNLKLNNNLLLNNTPTTTPINFTLDTIKLYLTERLGITTPFPQRPSLRSNSQYLNDDGAMLVRNHLDDYVKSVFNFEGIRRDGQDRILARTLSGKNVFGILPTGGGKSLCYWLPAFIQPGLTIVISPLKALMRDQELVLKNLGIFSVAFINSDVDIADRPLIFNDILAGQIRILYVAPERMRIKEFQDAIKELLNLVPINMLAVDETHCVSEWGHDFRPSFLGILEFFAQLQQHNSAISLSALTATASKMVRDDIMRVLSFADDDLIKASDIDRPNLSYQFVAITSHREKPNTYQRLFDRDIPTALQHSNFGEIIPTTNKKGHNSTGLVFCIYANPHGINSIHDGVPHYLLETIRILKDKNTPNDPETSYFDGSVRGYSSTIPEFCPHCKSPYFVANGNKSKRNILDDDFDNYDFDDMDDNNEVDSDNKKSGQKKCNICKKSFIGNKAYKVPTWDKKLIQNHVDFQGRDIKAMVTTKGFGMGIDKSSVRFIIHTSMASGLEGWYQEAGRAGRDGEHSHCVKLIDAPNEPCIAELEKTLGIPTCKQSCKHGKSALCDYGKQHRFICKSYPSVVTDVTSLIKTLCKLIDAHTKSSTWPPIIELKTSFEWQSKYELNLYRLQRLNIIQGFIVEYRRGAVVFHISKFNLSVSRQTIEYGIENYLHEQTSDMQDKYLADKCWIKYGDELNKRINKEKSKVEGLEDYLSAHSELFDATMRAGLQMLTYIYDNILPMRYGMLFNLLATVNITSNKYGCRRIPILNRLSGESGAYSVDYKCGFCDLCVPNLKFDRTTREPPQNFGLQQQELEKEYISWLNSKVKFDFIKAKDFISALRPKFRDFLFGQATQILAQSDPNNIKALYIARETCPENERTPRAIELIKRSMFHKDLANSQDILREFFLTGPDAAKEKSLALMEEDGRAFDNPEGEIWLYEQSARLDKNGVISRRTQNLELRLLMQHLSSPEFEQMLAQLQTCL